MRAANGVSREQRSESVGEVCGRPRCRAVLASARTEWAQAQESVLSWWIERARAGGGRLSAALSERSEDIPLSGRERVEGFRRVGQSAI